MSTASLFTISAVWWVAHTGYTWKIQASREWGESEVTKYYDWDRKIIHQSSLYIGDGNALTRIAIRIMEKIEKGGNVCKYRELLHISTEFMVLNMKIEMG